MSKLVNATLRRCPSTRRPTSQSNSEIFFSVALKGHKEFFAMSPLLHTNSQKLSILLKIHCLIYKNEIFFWFG